MSRKPKLTPWFPASVKPARVGVYNVDTLELGDIYRYWDGRHWSFFGLSPDGAMTQHAHGNIFTNGRLFPWRGLAEKPE
jgi:hypothetical protein